jgi:acetyl-CoA synthetase
LKNYVQARENFSWGEVEENFSWYETGKVNMAYEAIDRHAIPPKKTKLLYTIVMIEETKLIHLSK